MKHQLKPTWSYSRELSNKDSQVYVHSFPILKDEYSNRITIIGEFQYYKSEETIFTKVIDAATGTIYSPFYDRKYGNFTPILQRIENNINKEMKRIGIQICQ